MGITTLLKVALLIFLAAALSTWIDRASARHQGHPKASSELPPPDASFWFPKDPSWGWKYEDGISCEYLESPGIRTSDDVCQVAGADNEILTLSAPDTPTSVRYQLRQKVALWKKGSRYSASFSTRFVLALLAGAEGSEAGAETTGIGGAGGIAFAITPKPRIDDNNNNNGTLGLFPIDAGSGSGSASVKRPTRTLAIEIDLVQSSDSWDLPAPHIGLDLGSLRSSVASPLPASALDNGHKICVFIDYNSITRHLSVFIQDLQASGGDLDRSKATRYLDYYDLDLSDYVDEESYIGFSADVPVASSAAFALYHWKFDTKWVLAD